MAPTESVGYFRLRIDELLELFGYNLHETVQKARVSYPTMLRYRSRPETVESMHIKSVAAWLVLGLGIEPEELMKMRLGDIFQLCSGPSPEDCGDGHLSPEVRLAAKSRRTDSNR